MPEATRRATRRRQRSQSDSGSDASDSDAVMMKESTKDAAGAPSSPPRKKVTKSEAAPPSTAKSLRRKTPKKVDKALEAEASAARETLENQMEEARSKLNGGTAQKTPKTKTKSKPQLQPQPQEEQAIVPSSPKKSQPKPKERVPEAARRHFSARAKTIFADDSRVVVVEQNNILIVNAETGVTLAALQGHQHPLVSVIISPWNKTQLISVDADTTVKIWGLLDHTCLLTVEKSGVERVSGKYAIVFANNFRKVCRYDMARLDAGFVIKDQVETKFNGVIFQEGHTCLDMVAVSREGGSDLIVTASRRTLIVYDSKSKRVDRVRHDHVISCLAVHPTENLVAVGDTTGKLMMLRANNGVYLNGVRSIKHWHSAAVSSLAFNVDGSLLFSGGHEGVLVVWQVASGDRAFIPRLGGHVVELATSPGGSYLSAALSNGSVRIVDTRSREPTIVIGGLDSAEINADVDPASRKALAGFSLAVDPRNDYIAVQKTPGILQLYSSETKRQAVYIDVVQQNLVSNPGQDQLVVPGSVTHATFSASGERMVTVEARNQKRTLKFWALSQGKVSKYSHNAAETTSDGTWVVTTVVNNPHDDDVVAVLFHPNGRRVITASRDSHFKVWALREGSGEWTCRSLGFFRKEPILAAALSQDGSILAIANSSTVTLWNPETNEMICVLGTHRTTSANVIHQLCFFRQTRLAVLTTAGHIYSWDLITRQVRWQVRIRKAHAAAVADKLLVALTSNDHVLCLTFGDSPCPVSVTRTPARPKQVTGLSVLSHNRAVVSYKSGAVQIIDTNENQACTQESSQSIDHTEETQATSFQLFQSATGGKRSFAGMSASAGQGEHQRLHITASSASAMKDLDAFPSYVLPPLSKLAKSLLSVEDIGGSSDATVPEPKLKKQKGPRSHSASTQQEGRKTTEKRSSQQVKQDKALETNMTKFFSASIQI